MNPALEQLAHRIAGALFNGLYQGLILAAVLWLGLRLCRGLNAATRHAVGFVALVLVALLPVLHVIWPAPSDRPAEITIGKNSPDHELGGNNVDAPFPGRDPSAVTDSRIARSWWPPTEIQAPPAPAEVLPFSAGPAVDEPPAIPLPSDHPEIAPLLVQVRVKSTRPDLIGTEKVVPDLPDPVTSDAAGENPPTAAIPSISRLPFANRMQTWKAFVPGVASAIVILAVGLIAGVRLLRLAIQLVRLHRLKQLGAPAAGDLGNLFDNLCCESRLNRPARLLISDQIAAPMAVGYLQPVVLLPGELSASADDRGLQSILRHELAHVQRRDDWINLFQQFIHAALFFHPAVWWLSRRLTIDREIACDDHALARLESRHDYALFLTEFAGRSLGHDWIAAPAAWCKRSHLKERINMILDTQRNTSLRLARTSAGLITLATLATAGVVLIAGPRLVLAESSDQAASVASNGTSGSSSAASVSWNDDSATSVSASSGSASNDSRPDSFTPHAVVTLRNGRTIVTTPVDAGVAVNANVDLADVQPRLVVVNGTAPPEPPDEVTAPKGPKPVPGALPKPPRGPDWTPAPPDRSRESLERRMDRLERMLDKLTAERQEFRFKSPPEDIFKTHPENWNTKEFNRHDNQELFNDKLNKFNDKLKDESNQAEALLDAKRELDARQNRWPSEEQQKAIEKAMKDAQKEMARAMKNAEQKSREAERQAQFQAKIAQNRVEIHEGADARREALEAQRQAVKEQMHEIEQQKEKLEQRMNQLEEQMDQLEDREDNANDNEDSSLPKVKEKK